jgi:hypothetical protein
MIASLPMYWRAETDDAWRAFWAEVRTAASAEGLTLPDLTPPEAIPHPLTDHWLRPDLALSMTCGLPFRTALKGKVTYIGTLDFGLGDAPGYYHSQVIVRAGCDPAGPLRLAYNSGDSQSGWAVTQNAPPFAAPPAFRSMIETGGHAASLAALVDGRADIAYLDAVTWRILQAHDPNAAKVHPIGPSIATPGLPLIAAFGTDPAPLRRALAAACAAFRPETPMAMGGPLGFHVLPEQAYHAVPVPKPPRA